MTTKSTDKQLWEEARRAACDAALEAWDRVRHFYDGEYDVFEKPDGPCTEADSLADRLIVERLSEHYPAAEYGYLTEESEDRSDRLARGRVWIIDPIDGTRDFIKHSGNFAMHVAMVEQLGDGPWHPVVGVVYRPIAGRLYSAIRGGGTLLQTVPADQVETTKAANANEAAVPRPLTESSAPRVSDCDRITSARMVASNSNRTSRLMRLIETLVPLEHAHFGSFGVKVCKITEGEADFYVNPALGMSKEWDACAPHLILEEAGGRMTDLDGRELTYNQRDFRLNGGIIASNGRLHEELVRRVGEFQAQHPG